MLNKCLKYRQSTKMGQKTPNGILRFKDYRTSRVLKNENSKRHFFPSSFNNFLQKVRFLSTKAHFSIFYIVNWPLLSFTKKLKIKN